MILDSKNTIVRSNDVIVSNMGKEKVILSIANGKYYNLGELGGDIWERIDQPKSLKLLIFELLDVYEVERDQCEQHVLGFLQHLLEENLILVS